MDAALCLVVGVLPLQQLLNVLCTDLVLLREGLQSGKLSCLGASSCMLVNNIGLDPDLVQQLREQPLVLLGEVKVCAQSITR